MVQELDLCKTMADDYPIMICLNCCSEHKWNKGQGSYQYKSFFAEFDGENYYCRVTDCQLQGNFSLVEKMNGMCS